MNPALPATGNRSFLFLNATQFLGALNDNLFKLLLIFFLIDRQGPEAAGRVAAIAGAVFVIPFLLFSPLAGVLADRLRKSRLIVLAKAAEIGVMALGGASLWLESPLGLYLALFLMALQSTFFSPAKYGIVPEIVERQRLSSANGQLEAFTYLAIILGTTTATVVPLLTGGSYRLAGLLCVGIAVLGQAASFGVRELHPPAERAASCKPLEEFRRALTMVRRDRYLAMAVFGASLFMLIGAFVQLNLIPLGIQDFGLSQEQGGALFLMAALGIGAGSLAAGKLSGRNVELGVVPVGSALLFASSLYLAVPSRSLTLAAVAILVLGLGAGLFIVPLHAFIQFRAADEHRGKILAATNFLGWCGVLGAALLTHLINVVLGWPAHVGFFGLGLFMIVVTLAALAILPDFLLRFVALVLMKLIYRVRVRGVEHVPVEGGALLVGNHVSWLDALLLLSTQQRRIRFLMERGIYQTFFLRRLCKLMGVIPISAGDRRKELVEALNSARQALDEGYLVCIFAEGALTRNGTLQEFRPGFERIVRGSSHPVIPVHIGGIWGSIFSYKRGRLLAALPTTLPGPVAIDFGAPLPATCTSTEVRQAVMELSSHYFETRKSAADSLGKRFVRSARRHWRRPALADTSGQKLRFGETLIAALLLKERLREKLAGQEMVGVLLPSSVAGALANLALTLAGRVPVNLNFSSSEGALRSAVAQAGLRTILSSQKFLDKLGKKELGADYLLIEELLTGPPFKEKLRCWLAGRFLPGRWLVPELPGDPDALATVIFSSGSTAEPKGVMLSHHNILSNIDAYNMVFSVDKRDNICGILPLFHSFGFTGTLWFPLLTGFSAAYHPNPLDTGRIVKAVREHRSTFLLATPTFLSAYLRKADPEDFRSLRVVVTGAEKLGSRLAQDFAAKFGITPLEGYGATELSPVAALNLPDVEAGGVHQIGSRPESVGRPLPGVAVRILDPESGAVLGVNEPGMIEIRGPNVMLGYLNRPEKSAEVLRDGWYVTGDIGCLDEKGFLKISGRLSRFSKIAGEMVPHAAVEEILQKGLESSELQVAVTSVPDEKKGEKLVVLHLPAAGGVERLRAILDAGNLPNLWKPAPDCYLEVEEIPLLGTGKLDLRALRAIVEERLGKREGAAEREGREKGNGFVTIQPKKRDS
ncbi:MAG: MFS transporter [Deltaproteobacteria bacterium]|nr:MFS transporter [Deltaproteobacteria bacterium]